MKKISLPFLLLLITFNSMNLNNYALANIPIPTHFMADFGCQVLKSEADEIATFLIEMNDARIMDTQQGILARDKATSESIRHYGQIMINDQAMLKSKIEELAASKSIVLPTELSAEKATGLAELKKLEGKQFDKKLKKMLKKDHKRDIRAFKKASKMNDQAVSSFANENLPLLKEHLDRLKWIH